MNRCQPDKCKSKGFLGKKSADVGRCRIRLMRFCLFGCTRFFRLVVAFYELFRFINRNFTFNIFSGGFNQIVGWLEPVDGLQTDCSLPRISFFPFLRFALANVFVEVHHSLITLALIYYTIPLLSL